MSLQRDQLWLHNSRHKVYTRH